jgi:hypothetical protein
MFELLTIDYDFRLQCYCALAKCNYDWFLTATGGAERNLAIQREIIKGSKAYQTLRADLKRGCLLPPLVLAIKNLVLPPELTASPMNHFSISSMETLANTLSRVPPSDVYIIDGLQRTNAIKQTLQALQGTADESVFLARTARVEIWLNIPFGALAYRMLLLNAGQRPMSIKHQVEILSMKLEEELAGINHLEILKSLEAERRTKQGQFHLSKLAQAFQAWLQGTPNMDLRNLVMEQLLVESAIETLGSSLKGERSQSERDEFKTFVEWMVSADFALPANVNFFSNETVLHGIAAAVGAAERNDVIRPRMRRALDTLLRSLREKPDADALAIDTYESVRKGIDPAKVNVGQATREMVFKAFQEYFISDGLKNMSECWYFAAGSV